MGILDDLLAMNNSRNSTRILLSDTNKAIRPRATLITRFYRRTVAQLAD
jgi:hypothetical protein